MILMKYRNNIYHFNQTNWQNFPQSIEEIGKFAFHSQVPGADYSLEEFSLLCSKKSIRLPILSLVISYCRVPFDIH